MKRIAKKIFYLITGRKPAIVHKTNLVLGKNVNYFPSAIFITSGDGEIRLEDEVYIGRDVELGAGTGKIIIHDGASIQDRCIIVGDIEIGRYCTISLNVHMSSGRHYYNFKPELYIRDQDTMVQANPVLAEKHSQKVTIEDDCWLGINSVIMSGITVGKGSIIGANSVVTKNVEPYSIMVGAPAKLIKKRLDFVPKNELFYLNDADLPNFYSGFFTESNSLKESRLLGGIKVKDCFSVYMNYAGKTKIKLDIINTKGINLELAYDQQLQSIPLKEGELFFDIGNAVLHFFSIKSSSPIDNELGLYIKSVSVQ